ncbi:MAG: hypothetical protein ACXVIG_02730 [Halobacteriota archaeon]
MQIRQLKSRVFDILEYRSEDRITRLVGVFFTILIVLNVTEIVLTTVGALSQQLQEEREKDKTCPHCGERINEL